MKTYDVTRHSASRYARVKNDYIAVYGGGEVKVNRTSSKRKFHSY